MNKSTWRGHDIYFLNNVWRYESDDTPVSKDPNRKCIHCDVEQTEEGHDGCLGTLRGIMNACCGHGNDGEAYIQFTKDITVRGKYAAYIFRRLRNELMGY